MDNVLDLQQLTTDNTDVLDGCTGSWISFSDMTSHACPTTTV
jgi:hypothetical protein